MKNSRLESVSANKRLYEEKLEERKGTERSINSLQTTLNEVSYRRRDAKIEFDSYEWLQEAQAATDLVASLNEQVRAVDRDIKTIMDLDSDIAAYAAVLNKFSPIIEALQKWRDVFSDVDGRLAAAQADYASVKLKT